MRKLLVLLAFTIASALGAEGFSIHESIFIPPRFFVGDSVELRLLLEVEEHVQPKAVVSIPERQWLDIEEISVHRLASGKVRVRIFFVPFQSGVMNLPPLRLGDILLTDIKIDTSSVLDKNKTQLKGLRGQLLLPGTVFKFLAAGLVLIGVPGFLLLFLVWSMSLLRKLRQARLKARPHRRAVKVLKALGGEIDSDPRTFFITLIRALKAYLAERLTLPIVSATTEELAVYLHTRQPELEAAILTVVRRADRVKFAGAPCSRKTLAATLSQVETILQTVEAHVET